MFTVRYQNSSILNYSVEHSTVSMSKTVLFQTIHFSISMQFSFISPIDRAPSGATIPGQSEAGSEGNEEVLRIPQSSSITGTSLSDCLVSNLGLVGRVLPLCRGAVGVFYSPSRLGDVPHWSKGKWIVCTCACRHPRTARQISANWCCILKRMCIVQHK